MRRTIIGAVVALSVAALSISVAVDAAASRGSAGNRSDSPRLVAVGITDEERLVAFRTNRPEDVSSIGKVSGLKGDSKLVGIDYRVQDRKLYGVGNAGGIYTISTRSAEATKVSQLSVALQGTSFGVDFNPAANRLRVISDTGQNLRHNIDDPNGAPAAGMTATDGTLTYPPATPAAVGVTGAAYTNNDLDPNTATTLFDVDTMMDQIAIQSPANAGSLAGTGKLLVDAGSAAGFDIYSTLNRGTSTGTIGFATLQVDGRYGLYRVSTLTGAVTKVDNFPKRRQVVDIAISPMQ